MEVAVQTPLEPPFPDVGGRDPTNFKEDSSMAKITNKTGKISQDLAKDIVLYVINRAPSHPSVYASNMRRLVDKILGKHEILYKGIVTNLKLAEIDVHKTCCAIADELFADGKINWGRIVALYAFVGRLAKHFADHGLDGDEYTDALASYLGDYVVEKLDRWITEQGGWVS